MKLKVHNPRRRNPNGSQQVAEYLLTRVAGKNPNGPAVYVAEHPMTRKNPRRSVRRSYRRSARRSNPSLIPSANEWIDLATDGAGAVVGGFVAAKASEMFLKDQEGQRLVAALKRMAIGFLGMTLLRQFSRRFAKNFALGAAVTALQPLIVPFIETQFTNLFPESDTTKPGAGADEGMSGIYPANAVTNINELAGIYPSSMVNADEYPN